MEWIFFLIFALLLLGNIVQFGIIRGFMRAERSTEGQRHLTGREVEVIRRKLATVGMSAITAVDVYNLIMTIRDTHLGTYVDEDPYVPADPYEDVE